MTLGERIQVQRTEHRLSQTELAEQLEVSRQSVSKWETDASVPELDKLVKMCELFGVTLDKLVQGIEPEEPETPQAPSVQAAEKKTPVRITVGAVLLGAGLLSSVLLFALGGGLGGVILSLPFLVCGVICLTVRRHPWLLCGWALWVLVCGYLRYATGIRPWWVFHAGLYRNGMEIHALIAWGQLLTFAALAAGTWFSLRYGKDKPPDDL